MSDLTDVTVLVAELSEKAARISALEAELAITKENEEMWHSRFTSADEAGAALEAEVANRDKLLDQMGDREDKLLTQLDEMRGKRHEAEAELAEFKSRHTGGGCGCDATPE